MALKTLGQNPIGQRLQQIQRSPHYRDGVFQNIHSTPMNKEGGSTLKTMFEFMRTKRPVDIKPSFDIPNLKTDLQKNIAQDIPHLIWFGHSSYLIQFEGKNILVDPVFSGHASPISSAVRAFNGADLYKASDMPPIDILILTHDHYDHIDFDSVMQLRQRTQHIVCPLGVGQHLEFWGFKTEHFTELDWWQTHNFNAKLKITATPARHFSGRGFTRNKTLWCSYALELGEHRIFIGGDSGYDDQFKKIGEKLGGFHLALLECGQYGVNWPYIHMFPEQTVQAAQDLKAEVLMPVHWGKFVLSLHPWTEPIERALIKAAELQQTVTTPMIGEVLVLDGQTLPQSFWWRSKK